MATKREKSKGVKSEEKTNIGILLPKSLWMRFKIHCIQSDKKPGELVRKLIEEYLDREGKY